MPEGPGAEEVEVDRRAVRISSSRMSRRGRGGKERDVMKVFACYRGAQSGDERPIFFYLFTAGKNKSANQLSSRFIY
jgi:hypothetical protein